MTSGLPESVCLSFIGALTYPDVEWGPLMSQKPSLQKCIFQHEDLTKLTVVHIYDTIHFFFRKFVNLLRLEGKSHHFCLNGFIKICDETCKVQLFWTIKLFVLILTQLFEIKLSGVLVFNKHTLHEFHTTRTESRNSWWLIAWCFWHICSVCVY